MRSKMDFELELIRDNNNGYEYQFGQFSSGLMNGFGKHLKVKKDEASQIIECYEVGEFKNGKLNGLGKCIKDNKLIHNGFYKDGEVINTDGFIKNLSSEDVSEIQFDGIKHLGKRYYQDKNNGYQVIICDKKIVYFINGPQIEKTSYTYYRFSYLKDGKEVGLSIEYLLDAQGKVSKDKVELYLPEERSDDNRILSTIFNNIYWNYHGLIYDKTIKIKNGTTKVTDVIYKGKCGCVIYIPSSVTHLGPEIVKGNDNIFVQVYYDGTMEEWEKIEKGKVEWVMIDGATWYYYGHDAMPSKEFTDWVSGVWKVFIHCKNGDIKP